MSVRQDTVNLVLNINSNASQNQLNELRKRAADLAHEMKVNKKGTDEYIAAAKELKKVNADMADLKKTIGITALSQKELVAELNKLKAMKGSMTPFTQEFKDMQRQIEAVERRLYDVRNGVTGLASVFSRISDEVKQFGMMAAGYLGFQFISSQFKNIIRGAGDLSDQLADIRRVSGMTASEVDTLNKSLSRLDTRTSMSGLREISIIAGKLGVAKEDIAGFTKAVDMLTVTLGDELGSADQITTQLGKILNVFDGKVTGENVTRLGNAFVELANSGVATGGFIADFDQRLSGIAKSANIGLGALSGLGAGLEELGSRVESSATAVQKLIVKIAGDIPKAAKVAGMSFEEFKKLFAEDATEALLRYSEGLVRNKAAFDEVVTGLQEAGESGQRVIETIGKLGGSADLLRERVKQGSEAIQETSAIMDGFALKNETLGAALDKLGKDFYKFIMQSGIVDFLKSAVMTTIEWIRWLKDLPSFLQRNRITIAFLITALIALNKQLIISNLQWLRNRAAILLTTVAQTASATATLLLRTATLAYAAAQALATGNITRATAAMKLLNLAFKSSPVGALITLIVGLGVALDALFSKITAVQKAQQDLSKKSVQQYGDQVNKIENLKRALQSETVSYETKKAILKELIEINPQFAETLRLDADGHLIGAQAIDEYVKALKRKGEAEAAQELSNEQYKKILLLQQERAEWEKSEKFSDQARRRMIENIDKQIAKIQELKDFYDNKVLSNTDTRPTFSFVAPADTVLPGEEDRSVSARRAALQKKIEGLKSEYELLNAADQAGQRKNLALQKKYQDELDALDHKTNKVASRNSEYDRLRKEAEAFFKSVQKLKEDAINASKSDDERELIALQAKYDEMQAKALDFFKKNVISRSAYQDQVKTIAEAFNLELAELHKKQFEKTSDQEYSRAIQDTKDYFETQRNLAGQHYAEDKINKIQYDAEITALDLAEKDQLVNVATDYAETVKKAEEDLHTFRRDQDKATTQEAIAQAEARIRTAKSEALAKAQLAVIAAPEGSRKQLKAQKNLLRLQFDQDTEHLDKKSEAYKLAEAELNAALEQLDLESRQRRLQAFDEFAQQLLSITDNFINALNNLDQREISADKEKNEAKKNNYKKQLDGKLLSQRQYDRKVAEADAELEKKKKEVDARAWKRQQALAISAALINGALAVTSTLAARPGMADIFTLGAARAIQVGLVVAATAAQIAAIATQKPPTAARGRWFRKGKKHKDGGINVEIEKDEAVMMAKAMTDGNQYTVSGTPAQITSKLNSMHGGLSWAPGGKLTPRFMERPPLMNASLPRIMEQGGIVRDIKPSPEKNIENENLLRQLIAKQDELITEVKNQKERLHAVVSIKEYRQEEKKYDSARKAAGMDQ